MLALWQLPPTMVPQASPRLRHTHRGVHHQELPPELLSFATATAHPYTWFNSWKASRSWRGRLSSIDHASRRRSPKLCPNHSNHPSWMIRRCLAGYMFGWIWRHWASSVCLGPWIGRHALCRIAGRHCFSWVKLLQQRPSCSPCHARESHD